MSGYVAVFSLIILIVALVLNIYNNDLITFLNHYLSDKLHSTPKKVLFTASELAQYNGLTKPDLFLAVLGVVYNVSKGADNYGTGKTYNIFVGRDASRSFVTGKFDAENASDDVTGLNKQDIQSLNHWIKFYKKQYRRVGKLIERYYNENGQATPYNKEIQKLIKSVESEKRNQELENIKFPPCNMEWNAEMGKTRFWCSSRSGGIERSWIGVPRQLYEPGSDSYRCACISDENRNIAHIREYNGCDPNHDSCSVDV